MQPNHETIWSHTIQFLSTYQPLQYDQIPLNLLLFRDFQKFIQKKELYSTATDFKETMDNASIQKTCLPYLVKSEPHPNQKGHTLIRAHLYPLFKGCTNIKPIYLAHHRKEYVQMKKVEGCHPLIYLRDIPEAKFPAYEEERVNRTLETIQSSSLTPDYFKNPAFTKWITKRIPLLLKRIRRMHTLFYEYNICRTIYGSTVNRHGSLVTTFAQSRSIFTVNIQHGLLGELGHFPVNADLNLVWGQSHRDYLMKHGASKNNIQIIGPVFFRNVESKTKLNKQTRKLRAEFRILLAMQPLGLTFNQKLIKTIEHAVKNLPKKTIVNYKLHPDQLKPEQYKKHLMNKGSTIIPHGKIPLNELIWEADVIITPFSTVAYESLLHNKPVIFYQDPGELYYLCHSPLYVKNESDLRKILIKALQNENFLSSLQSRFTLKDRPNIKTIKPNKLLRVIKQFEKHYIK